LINNQYVILNSLKQKEIINHNNFKIIGKIVLILNVKLLNSKFIAKLIKTNKLKQNINIQLFKNLYLKAKAKIKNIIKIKINKTYDKIIMKLDNG